VTNPTVNTVNGPTDMEPDALAERKRLAAVDYHTRELAALTDSLAKIEAKGGSKDKIANQKQMIAEEKAALAAVEGA
jgi:hypothetical protein